MCAAISRKSNGAAVVVSSTSVKWSVLPALISLELVALGIQFALGVYLTLFVTLPSPIFGMYGMMALMFSPGAPVLMGHMLIGMVLGILAFLGVVGATLTGDQLLVATTSASFASVVGAGIAGMEFLFSGDDNVFSYGMSIGFLLAFTFAFLSLALVLRRRT